MRHLFDGLGPFRARRPRSRRVQFGLESLEERTVLSQMLHVSIDHGAVAEVAKAKSSKMTVTSLVINDVALSNDQLLANATLNGTIKKQAISIPMVIPISLTPAAGSATPGAATPDAATATQILNLSLGPVNLSLLGLNIHLGANPAFGDTAPITAQVVAIPTGATYTSNTGAVETGGLLGDVLSDVANLLNSGGGLSGLGTELNSLETNLTSALNQILGGLNSATDTAATTKAPKVAKVQHAMAVNHAIHDAANPGGTEILELPLGPINLDVLGAFIQTSTIVLNITATKGPGDLLGNLLA